MKSKKQTINRSIWEYTLLPVIITLLFFYGTYSVKAQSDTIQKDTMNNKDTLAMQTSNVTLIDFVEALPQFPGGDKELLKWVINNIRYPEEAIKNKIEGRVFMRFLIKSDGSIDDVTVMRSLYPACDSEAVRVLKMMPNWIPAKQNDIPVDVYYQMPVFFKIPEMKTPETIENIDSTVVLPKFPGGEMALLKFLVANTRYPDEAIRNNIQGRVTASFLVMADGTISDVKILQNVHPSLDKEAFQVIKRMPKWIPGTKDGKPVNVYYTLPVTFRLP